MLSLLGACALFALLAGVLSVPAGAVGCEKKFVGASGGDWSTAANWEGATLPGPSTVVCWSAGTTVVVSSAGASAGSIEAGGELEITGGKLELAGPGTSSIVGLHETGGQLVGPGSLALSGAFLWAGGLIGSETNPLAITQTGGGEFKVSGAALAILIGGSITTTSPIAISDPKFQGARGATLKTSSTLKLAAVTYEEEFERSLAITAAGVETEASAKKEGTTLPDYILHLTGTDSSLTESFTLPALTLDKAATLQVPTATTLKLSGSTTPSTISGTISGPGRFALVNGSATTVPSAGKLETASVGVEGGKINVESGATYSTSTATSIAIGVLALGDSATIHNLTVSSGLLDGGVGGGSLSVTGSITWTGGGISDSEALAISQTGGGSFEITGPETGKPLLLGGTFQTTSPITIDNPGFASAHTTLGPTTLTTTSTLSFGAGVVCKNGGEDTATIIAAGITANSGAEYGLQSDSITLTGGTTTVAAGHTLRGGGLKIEGGALHDEGTITVVNNGVPSQVTLTGGRLDGTGTVSGSVTNAGGTVEAGEAPAIGTLNLTGSYEEGAGGTLGVEVAGTAPGSGFDQLLVKEGVKLGGSVSVQDSGFTPVAGETFKVIGGASTRSGEFATVVGPSGSLYSALYESDGAKLSANGAVETPPGEKTTTTTTATTTTSTATPSALSSPPPASAPLSLLLACSGKYIELVTVRLSGNAVYLSGIARPQFAGQKVKITLSDVPRKVAAGRGGTTTVAADGSFQARLAVPKGRGAGLTRYTATVAGHASLGLKLSRMLQIVGESNVAGGLQVTFKASGLLAKESHTVTIAQQVSCTKNIVFERTKLTRGGELTVTLPTPSGTSVTAYYRAQTPVPGGLTYSLPIAVKSP